MITRRKLLGGGLSAFSLSTLLNLKLMSRASADVTFTSTDRKGLICLYLPGGIDSYNVLVPSPTVTNSRFPEYSQRRGSLALETTELLSAGLTGTPFTLHASLPKLLASFNNSVNSRKVAFVSGVGPVKERSSGRKFTLLESNVLPSALQSHSDQSVQWQTSVPDASEFAGWAGRVGEWINSQEGGKAEMYTLDGNQVFVNGPTGAPLHATGLFSLDAANTDAGDWPTGIPIRNAVKAHSGYPGWRSGLLDRITAGVGSDGLLSPFAVNGTYYSLLQHAAASRIDRSIKNGNWFHEFLNEGRNSQGLVVDFDNDDVDPVTELDNRIQLALKIIRSRTQMEEANRVVVFVPTPVGWDHHANLKESQGSQLTDLDEAIDKFFHWTEANDLAQKVVLFTASEFGRTLTINPSSGSDHAWSGVQFVCGHGDRINTGCFGVHPWDVNPVHASLTEHELNFDNDGFNRGVLSPVIAVDDYYRDLGRWFGLDEDGFELVLPNLFGLNARLKDNHFSLSSEASVSSVSIPMVGDTGDIGFFDEPS